MKISKKIMEEIAKMYFEEGFSPLEISQEFACRIAAGCVKEYDKFEQITVGNILYCIEEMQYKYHPVIVLQSASSYEESDAISMFEQGYSEREIAKKYNCVVGEVTRILTEAAYVTRRMHIFPDPKNFVQAVV